MSDPELTDEAVQNRLAQSADPRVMQTEIVISALLRSGVLISLSFVVLGTLITFAKHTDYVSLTTALPTLTRPGATFPHTVAAVIRGIRNLEGNAVTMLGLLLLIATPVLRVAVSIFAFIFQKDRVFTVITLIVLSLLLISFALGKAI